MASTWGDEYVVDALKKLIPFLFRSFCNLLIFKSKKIGGTKTGSQLATLSVIFSSAQALSDRLICENAVGRNNERSDMTNFNTPESKMTVCANPGSFDRIIKIARSYNARRLLVFGSSLENPEKARDIDLACDGIEGWKLYEFGAELERKLDMPVDIVPLRPATRLTRYIESKGRKLL